LAVLTVRRQHHICMVAMENNATRQSQLQKAFFDRIRRFAPEIDPSKMPQPPPEFIDQVMRFSPDGIAAELPPPHFIDPLSVMIDDACVKSLVARQSRFTAPWGVEFPGFGCSFCAIQQGQCIAQILGRDEWLHLEAGDLIIFLRRQSYILKDQVNSQVVSVVKLMETKDLSEHPGIFYGGGGQETTLIHGGFMFDHSRNGALIGAMPEVVHLSNRQGLTQPWLKTILSLIDDEIEKRSAGCYAIMNHLVQIILIQAIRNAVAEFQGLSGNCLSALSDPDIASALDLIHRHGQYGWSVQKLADEVGMSRSVFAERFAKVVGQSPIAYLLERRMSKAARLLKNTQDSLRTIAKRVGYGSEATFGAAFKRWSGISPGRYRSQLSGNGPVPIKDHLE
jgi:AraC-like DNA-binding protein